MKVHELIAELTKYNTDTDVIVNDLIDTRDITSIFNVDGGVINICTFTKDDAETLISNANLDNHCIAKRQLELKHVITIDMSLLSADLLKQLVAIGIKVE